MPVVAPIMKIQNCKKYGAKVIIHGQNIAECRDYAMKIAKKEGLLYVNGLVNH
jgi:threonine dehydratase